MLDVLLEWGWVYVMRGLELGEEEGYWMYLLLVVFWLGVFIEALEDIGLEVTTYYWWYFFIT